MAWSPDDIDGRDYDYRGLADASDAFYVMDYDTRSQASLTSLVKSHSSLAAVACPIAGARHTALWVVLNSRLTPESLVAKVPRSCRT